MADTRKDPSDNRILPFQIEGTDVRGQIIRLGSTVNEVLTRHNYPKPVSVLLGETLCLAALMGASLKFDGKLILQLHGDGPVEMVVADYTTDGAVRGYAKFQGEALAALTDPSWAELMGTGHMAITIDQGPDMERYQGLVSLEGESFVQAALRYFAQSEQILTGLRLSVAEHIPAEGSQEWRAGGIMAQSLPPQNHPGHSGATDKSLNDWERANVLLQTTEDHELVDPTLSPEQLLYRLYHEDGVRVFDAKQVRFECSCSADRIRDAITSFSADERDELADDGVITAKCEFCNTQYAFAMDEF